MPIGQYLLWSGVVLWLITRFGSWLRPVVPEPFRAAVAAQLWWDSLRFSSDGFVVRNLPLHAPRAGIVLHSRADFTKLLRPAMASVSKKESQSEMIIRIFQVGDHEAIAEIFTRAIHEIASEDYTLEQCLAWSDRQPNPKHWEQRCQKKKPFVAVIGGRIAGFLELDPDGHIDCAYSHPEFARQGVMTALVHHARRVAEEAGTRRMWVEASICARPLFEKCGFVVQRENLVDLGGVELINYWMELRLIGETQSSPSCES
ncbi:GNAT family N-acetyltransferase [Luteolibacter pohnpeiensis]|uniref:GNAT family N-acetyltransferase n=1 Tax=Luteolibacter pohnpeiensis TaxID=454153 RepID=A0A934S270_9BACT|nr:GNAT family N-acetyltransferase [Luteolibacter pohnpeiensis]MBK1881830.1 GNAT family N-acetyltransferase [Luteolibacter pohnpeiensis]